MLNVMLDLETLGQRPGCAILSIGAVAFDPDHGIGRHFYQVVNTRSCCERYGLHQDAGTLKWWDGQSDEARQVLREAEASKLGLGEALKLFSAFLDNFNRNSLCVWGNGSDFDNAIMAHCYAVTQQLLPWKFWNNRCFRTLRAISGRPKARAAVKHNALQDANDQAIEAIAIMKALRNAA